MIKKLLQKLFPEFFYNGKVYKSRGCEIMDLLNRMESEECHQIIIPASKLENVAVSYNDGGEVTSFNLKFEIYQDVACNNKLLYKQLTLLLESEKLFKVTIGGLWN